MNDNNIIDLIASRKKKQPVDPFNVFEGVADLVSKGRDIEWNDSWDSVCPPHEFAPKDKNPKYDELSQREMALACDLFEAQKRISVLTKSPDHEKKFLYGKLDHTFGKASENADYHKLIANLNASCQFLYLTLKASILERHGGDFNTNVVICQGGVVVVFNG